MADSGANAGGDQALVVALWADFGQASELGPTEVGSGAEISSDACGEERGGWNPRPWRRIEGCRTPRPRHRADADPHHDPGGDEHAEGRALFFSPSVGAR